MRRVASDRTDRRICRFGRTQVGCFPPRVSAGCLRRFGRRHRATQASTRFNQARIRGLGVSQRSTPIYAAYQRLACARPVAIVAVLSYYTIPGRSFPGPGFIATEFVLMQSDLRPSRPGLHPCRQFSALRGILTFTENLFPFSSCNPPSLADTITRTKPEQGRFGDCRRVRARVCMEHGPQPSHPLHRPADQ